MTEITVENQAAAYDTENVYRGKKWGFGKLLGIFAAILATVFVRDLGMAFVYGSIYDGIAENGMDESVTILHYVFMILLFAIPMVFPFILRFTQGAYFDEPQTSLMPAFNKVGTIISYIVVGIVAVIPVALSLIGIFTPAYMFVATNMALVLASGVVLFYYFGTYFLQRAKASLGVKYTIPTLIMAVTGVVSYGLTTGAVLVLNLLGGEEGGVAIVGHVNAYMESLEPGALIVPAAIMIGFICVAAVVSGLLYNMSQNILVSVVPTFIVTYANIILIQRINEATSNIAKWNKDIENLTKRPTNNSAAKILEIQEKIPSEETNIAICYVVIGVMAVIMLAIAIRAIIGLVANKKEAK